MALRIALSGFAALIVAMGIGRFAFTPQVPLMIADHQFSLTGAGLVAAINYLGYLCGAYDAMRATRHAPRRAAPVAGRMGRDGADAAVGVGAG